MSAPLQAEALEQFLDDRVLHAALAGKADQAMGIHRVGSADDPVEMEFEPDRGSGPR